MYIATGQEYRSAKALSLTVVFLKVKETVLNDTSKIPCSDMTYKPFLSGVGSILIPVEVDSKSMKPKSSITKI